MFTQQLDIARLLAWTAVACVVLVVGLFQLRFIISGPSIEYANQYMYSDSSLIEINLMVRNTKRLEINHNQVVPEFGGKVSTVLALQGGLNTVSVDAWDNYGKHTREYLYIVYPQ